MEVQGEICEFGKGGDGGAKSGDVFDAWGKGGERGIFRGGVLGKGFRGIRETLWKFEELMGFD